MTALRLRLLDPERDVLVLDPGVHAVTPAVLGTGDASAREAVATIYVDSRGIWMQLRDGLRGAYLNGRPVRHMAMLRPGDSLFLEGVECVLLGREPSRPGSTATARTAAMPPLLRAVAGPSHGRCFSLDRSRLIGPSPDASIRTETQAEGVEAEVQVTAEGAVASVLSGGPMHVNGHPVDAALLQPGDQLVIGQHRLVLEAARLAAEAPHPAPPAPRNAAQPHLRRAVRRLPWLLLAALLLAAALSLLLLYGTD